MSPGTETIAKASTVMALTSCEGSVYGCGAKHKWSVDVSEKSTGEGSTEFGCKSLLYWSSVDSSGAITGITSCVHGEPEWAGSAAVCAGDGIHAC